MFRLLATILILQSCMPGEYQDLEKTDVIIEENESYKSGDGDSRTPAGSDDGSSVSISPQLGDRFYIESVFKNVFGPEVSYANIVHHRIIKNQNVFGGPCDPYENLYKENYRGDGSRYYTSINLNANCQSGVENTTKLHLSSTSLRQGWIIRTCEDLLRYNSKAVNYALETAGALKSANFHGDFSYETVNNLYKTFTGVKDLDPSVHQVMLENKNGLSEREFWEATLMTFCISPDWQYL